MCKFIDKVLSESFIIFLFDNFQYPLNISLTYRACCFFKIIITLLTKRIMFTWLKHYGSDICITYDTISKLPLIITSLFLFFFKFSFGF